MNRAYRKEVPLLSIYEQFSKVRQVLSMDESLGGQMQFSLNRKCIYSKRSRSIKKLLCEFKHHSWDFFDIMVSQLKPLFVTNCSECSSGIASEPPPLQDRELFKNLSTQADLHIHPSYVKGYTNHVHELRVSMK